MSLRLTAALLRGFSLPNLPAGQPLVVSLAVLGFIFGAGSSTQADAATTDSMASADPCGALYIKTSLWGAWSEHGACGGTDDVAISPDGRLIAVIYKDGSIWAKQGLWATWQQHTPADSSKAFALGPNGMMAQVTPCGALFIKTSLWGAWSQHMGCGSAKDVAISPDGRTIAVIDERDSIWAKQGLWATWQQHTPDDASRALALGPNGMMANATPCGGLYIKTSHWGQWSEHGGCGDTEDVAISPDGRTIAVLLEGGSIWAKQGLWATWHQHTASGQTKALAVGPAVYNPQPPPTSGKGFVVLRRSGSVFEGTVAGGLAPAGATITNVRFTPTPAMGTVWDVKLSLNGMTAVMQRTASGSLVQFTTAAFNGRSPVGEWRAYMSFVDFHADAMTLEYDWVAPR